MNEQSILKQVRMARTFCAEQLPWFAPILYAGRIQLSREVPVAAIAEDLRVFFNPDAVEQIWAANSPETALRRLGYIWAHEIAHVLRDHGQRAQAIHAAPKLWNLAADLEINDAEWPGLEPPIIFPPCLPQNFCLPKGLLAEQYYKSLVENDTGTSAQAMTDEGSGVHGRSRSWEKSDHPIESKDAAPASTTNEDTAISDDLEIEQLRSKVQRLLDRAAERGELPQGLTRWVGQGKSSKMDWRKILAQLIRQRHIKWATGRHDYSRRRPHRRQHILSPFVLPALTGQPAPMSVACVVDTSGSMEQNALTKILAEVEKIMDTLNCEVMIIPCDARAYPPIPLKRRADLQKIEQLPGGGGTNMVVGIAAALALQPAPALVVVFTDGYTTYPPHRYAIPVVWGLVEDGFRQAPRPPEEVWPESSIVRIRN